jgi:hypothetical protein
MYVCQEIFEKCNFCESILYNNMVAVKKIFFSFSLMMTNESQNIGYKTYKKY